MMRTRLGRRGALLIAASLALAGCHLVDRQDFAPFAKPPAPTQLTNAALPDKRDPLVTIRYETPDPAYEGALAQAVSTAESRTSNLIYDIIAVVPQNNDPIAQLDAVTTGRDNAASVMRSIMAQNVPDTRIRLAARIDPNATAPEIRVYVR
jgi:hypothetical protein